MMGRGVLLLWVLVTLGAFSIGQSFPGPDWKTNGADPPWRDPVFLRSGRDTMLDGTLMGSRFREFHRRVTEAPPRNRNAIVDSFMTAVSGKRIPFVEDTIACFLYRGPDALSVAVAGDLNGWNPNASPMTRLSTTDLWYLPVVFESDARIDYKLVVNGSAWMLDAGNPRTCTGGFGPNSELAMPAYVYPPEIQSSPRIPHGTLVDTTYTSASLGNSRPIRIYTPPQYNPAAADRFPVALFHDGLEWISLAYATNTFDYLINAHRVKPFIGVFVPPVGRGAEYGGAQRDRFSAFIVNDLMAYIDSRYRTRQDPASRAVIGISSGSMISLWIGYYYSGTFGNVGAFSGVNEDDLFAYRNGPSRPLKLYVDVGTYENPIAGGYDLLTPVRSLHGIIQSKGYVHEYREWHEGHSWGNWRAHLDNVLEFFFPGSALEVQDRQQIPTSFALWQNSPNPFYLTTVIAGQWPVACDVKLVVYDLQGREVNTLTEGRYPAGRHSFTFDSGRLPVGIYLYRLKAGSFSQTRKMLLIR
jgi:enterochelin esterase-like enzyme